MKSIKILLKKEISLELRNKGSFYANVLFVVSSTYVASLLAGNNINLKVWSAIYWIIMMFTSFNVTLNGSLKESRTKLFYQYTLFGPTYYFLSKALWYFVFIFILNLLGFLLWGILGIGFDNGFLFCLVLLLNSIVFSCLLSVLSFLSAKANGNFALMSILSLPILIPDLLIIAKLSTLLLDDFAISVYSKYLTALGVLSLISLILGLVLFPYLWKE